MIILEAKPKTLEEDVYTRIGEDILTGVFERGEALTELMLCKRLGVSRTPVRAALHRLCEEGLVEITPNKGAVVAGITKDDLIDTYKVRMRLEGLASELCAERISTEALDELEEAVSLAEYYIAKNDTEKLKELDTRFHSIIYYASGNRMLCRILTELHKNIKAYRKLSLSVTGRGESSHREHRLILEAIKRKEGKRADELTSMHIKNAMDNMLLALEEDNK